MIIFRIFLIILRNIVYIPLKRWVIFVKSWTSTGSSVTSGRFSPSIQMWWCNVRRSTTPCKTRGWKLPSSTKSSTDYKARNPKSYSKLLITPPSFVSLFWSLQAPRIFFILAIYKGATTTLLDLWRNFAQPSRWVSDRRLEIEGTHKRHLLEAILSDEHQHKIREHPGWRISTRRKRSGGVGENITRRKKEKNQMFGIINTTDQYNVSKGNLGNKGPSTSGLIN